MIQIFCGENRAEAAKALKRRFPDGYEVFEGENLQVGDLPSIFQGTSLFGTEQRRILLKDVAENTAVWEKIGDYLATEHEVVIWEGKMDKRSSVYKKLKDKKVEIVEFPILKKPEANLVFGVFDLALNDGERAIRELEKIEGDQDPYMFFGLLVSQALKRFEMRRGGAREKRMMKELAELDLQMKKSKIPAWDLVKGFLLRAGKI